ncbi:hypothetical protein [Achromobacter xylosoxidans]|uniref:hypothetical protein n=1 Tax=Alcaligenes xylosoxydans xylosoxydans TaxID=85698 RepID=UPI003D290C68
MTQQDDITQRVLTDDEINDLCGWRASNTTMRAENDRALAREVESALLSKLRAPVAGEAVDWYERRRELEPGMIFRTTSGVVKLDRGVPGDGTKWYVLDWNGDGWSAYDDTVEPGDLIGAPVADHPIAIELARSYAAPQASAATENCGLCGRTQLVEGAPQASPVAGEATYYAVMHGQALFGVFETETVANECIAKSLHPGVMSIRPLYAAPQASAEDVTRDLVALVVKLARSIRKSDPAMYGMALDFLKRHNLQGSPLRGESTTPPTGPTQAQCKAAAEIARGFGARHLADVLDPPQADKDGGQQRAGDAERWRWATATDENAQMLCTIVQAYGGDQQKINERADFYRAALSATQAEQGERDAG